MTQDWALHRRARASARCAVVSAVLLLTAAVGGPAHAQAADAPTNCRSYGVVQVCAMHVSITPLSMGSTVRIEASVSVQVRNVSQLAVRAFYNIVTDVASITPDRGPALSGQVNVVGMTNCRANFKDCILDQTNPVLTITPGSTANFIMTLTRDLPLEVVQHMALATAAGFTGSFEVVDGDGQFSKLSLSLPVAVLDNGLTK